MPSGMIFVVIVAAHVRRRIQAALVGGGALFHRGGGPERCFAWSPNERRDIVLMDNDSEKERCLDLCREMQSMSGVPAFISAAQKCDRHKVNALDAGADDYMVKPLAT